MSDIVLGVVLESWHILNDSAPFILFGLFMAGVLKVFMPEDFVATHLGGNDVVSVVKASLFGVPLPLCSCGVVPVAMDRTWSVDPSQGHLLDHHLLPT